MQKLSFPLNVNKREQNESRLNALKFVLKHNDETVKPVLYDKLYIIYKHRYFSQFLC